MTSYSHTIYACQTCIDRSVWYISSQSFLLHRFSCCIHYITFPARSRSRHAWKSGPSSQGALTTIAGTPDRRASSATICEHQEREFFIDNLLVRIQLNIEMIVVPALSHGSLNSLFQVALYIPSYASINISNRFQSGQMPLASGGINRPPGLRVQTRGHDLRAQGSMGQPKTSSHAP